MALLFTKKERQERYDLAKTYLGQGLKNYEIRAKFVEAGHHPPSNDMLTKGREELGISGPTKKPTNPLRKRAKKVQKVSLPVQEKDGQPIVPPHDITSTFMMNPGTVVVQMPGDLKQHLLEWMVANGVESFRRTEDGNLAITIKKEVIL